MPIGRSLHVGINQVSPAFPNATRLDGPENDADRMRNLARDRGFQTDLIPPSDADRGNVIKKLLAMAEASHPGDIFLFTFAGHGTSRIMQPDLDRDEIEDQAILLYDRWFYDDEFKLTIWPAFRKGVRVLMVADSCFSGTVASKAKAKSNGLQKRAISDEVREEHLKTYGEFYRQLMVPVYAPVEASILLLAACEDFDETPDGYPLGPFTAALLKVVNEQDPQNYTDLIEKIRKLVGPQVPQLFPFPRVDQEFGAQKPLMS